MTRILLIEDEVSVASFIKKGLTENNYSVHWSNNGDSALQNLKQQTFDLIILDLMLPDMSGIEICRTIRTLNPSIPVLMLTALGTTTDKVNGLDSGADDYLVKPFDFIELLARIRTLLRRSNITNTELLTIFDLSLNNKSKKVFRNNTEIKLTLREFTLLEYFMKNKGRVLSRSDLANNVWDNAFDTGTNVIDVYVNYLRNKIDKGFEPKLIHTVVGMGYVLKE